jgi:nicotinate-nucleotide adenylyltransferase
MTGAGANWIRPPGPVAVGLRVGLLGGSFNPPHEGHLHVSEVALKRLGLDYVWWLVSPQNPLKPARGMAPLAERLSWARELTSHAPRIRVTDIERELGARYTVDTIAKLLHRFPVLRFVWLMGSDNLMTFHLWRDWRELARHIPIAVVIRPGSALAPLTAKAAQYLSAFKTRNDRCLAAAPPPAFAILEARRSDASATSIRARQLALPTALW